MCRHFSKYRAFPVLILLIPAVAATNWPVTAKPPSPADKCPVCGMFVAKYPDWVAQIRFTCQTRVYFDGAKDFFKYYFNIGKYYPGKSATSISAMYVTDYYTVTFIDAAKAFFVIGSDVYGPMGKELIPLSSASSAKEFLKDHHGKAIVRFEAVTPDLLRTLN